MSRIKVPTMSGAEYRAAAKAQHDAAEESFQRCDTDGFISQWASGLSAREDQALAQLADDGGLAEFPGLFDLEGNLVPAKLIDTRYGLKWAVFGSAEEVLRPGSHILEWLTMPLLDSPRSVKVLERKGYRQGLVKVPAGVTIHGSGKGLSGAASCSVAVVRLDKGFSPDAEIVWNGQE